MFLTSLLRFAPFRFCSEDTCRNLVPFYEDTKVWEGVQEGQTHILPDKTEGALDLDVERTTVAGFWWCRKSSQLIIKLIFVGQIDSTENERSKRKCEENYEDGRARVTGVLRRVLDSGGCRECGVSRGLVLVLVLRAPLTWTWSC